MIAVKDTGDTDKPDGEKSATALSPVRGGRTENYGEYKLSVLFPNFYDFLGFLKFCHLKKRVWAFKVEA
ncbi:hypothetical protein SLE2022_111790 [Rubroshorea leprosula]